MKMNLETWENINEDRKMVPYVYRDGKNQIRIVGDPKSFKIHWAAKINGPKQRIICPGEDCPLCEIKNIAIKRYFAKGIVRSDQKGHILEFGITIVRQILTYVNDPQYGNPSFYDLNIEKIGAGKTTQYKVHPLGKSSLTADEQTMIDALNLDDLVRPNTVEEIRSMQLVGINQSSHEKIFTVTDDDWENITLE